MLKKRKVIPKILIKKLDIQKEKVIVSLTTKSLMIIKLLVASKSSNNF